MTKADEIAGFPSLERGVDPIIGAPGSHQYLGRQANHHADQSTIAPNEGNRIPRRSLPLISGPKVGKPSAVNPAGHGLGNSLDGDGGGDE